MHRHEQPRGRGFAPRNGRFQKPRNHAPQQWPRSNCTRPPAFFPRRRIMSNRFSSPGFGGPMMRRPPVHMDYPSPNFHHQPSPPNFGHQRPPFRPGLLDNSNHRPFFPQDDFDDPKFNNNDDVWIEATAPDGKIYYYNARTRVTRWDRPENVRLQVDPNVQESPRFESPACSLPPVFYYAQMPFSVRPLGFPAPFVEGPQVFQEVEYQGNDHTFSERAPPSTECESIEKNRCDPRIERVEPRNQEVVGSESGLKNQGPEEKVDKTGGVSVQDGSAEDKDRELQMSAVDKSRPVSSTPVSGTNWSVVWTGNQKVFFFDVERRVSVWDIPEELSGRSDVQKLVAAPPSIGPEAKKVKVNADGDLSYDARVKMFEEMLAEKNVSAFSSWEKELHKLAGDPRYSLLSSMDRKGKFEEYVKSKVEVDMSRALQELQKSTEDFKALLREAKLTSGTRYYDFAQEFRKDPRFRAVEKAKDREALFMEYIEGEERCEDFLKLLRERKDIDADSKWAEVEQKIADNPRYKAVTSEETRERLFGEYLEGLKSRGASKTNKERPKYDSFKALLEAVFDSPFYVWSDVAHVLKEERLNFGREDELRSLFRRHIFGLKAGRREQFRRMLDDLPEVTLGTRWKDVSKIALMDPRSQFFSKVESECEREFTEYMRERVRRAKEAFRELLKESRLLTHKSKSLLRNEGYFHNVESVLSKDRRYSDLECFKEERKGMLLSYIDELDHESFKIQQSLGNNLRVWK